MRLHGPVSRPPLWAAGMAWVPRTPRPAVCLLCIKSWKKKCPDYRIIEWNEDNFDVNQNLYCKQAYENRKWAFVTDYARLWILYNYGGVYFDTDVQMIKNIDKFLNNPCFMCIEKSIRCNKVNTGLGIGSEPNNPVIKAMLDDYLDPFVVNGSFDLTTCTVKNTEILKTFGFVEEDKTQKFDNFIVYSSEYFSPIEMENGFDKRTKNTHTIHHYSLSWTTAEKQLKRKKLLKQIKRNELIYNIKVLPNSIVLKFLGKEKYDKIKRKFGK